VALCLGYVCARLFDRVRVNNARARVGELTEQARREAEALVRTAELQAKEEIFKKREEFEREADVKRGELRDEERRVEQARGELRDEERRLGKREDNLLKKERSLEHNQRKLSERRSEVEKRHAEVDELVQKQNQLLHQI